MTHRHKFIIEAIDPETDCVAHDALFGVDDLNDIRAQLNLDEFDPREVYELDESDIDRLKSRYAVSFRANGLTTVLRPWIWVDDLPYKVHTNRELALMLAGSKPLAVFCDVYPSDFADEIIPETLYEPHVRSGRFLKRECIREYRSQRATTTARQLRTVLYALPGHEWRIDAYLLLQKVAEKSGWNEGFERMQGSLLGYEDWQNDIYMEMARARRSTPTE